MLAAGLAAAEAQGVRGKDVTPFLLEFFHRETGGAIADARTSGSSCTTPTLAARIAAAFTALR